ncbi:MAG: hypothetical protein JNK78_20220 [Planctomycetes bacterium]|nr:hypothetical protein [Planctomycetota bacterium]
MATNPVQPAVPQKPNDPHVDDYSGVYGFFRRHQKKLLYTAGLFTLLTFSITGQMLSVVGELFHATPPMPTIAVGGKRIELTPDDYRYGDILARNIGNSGSALATVLPMLNPGEGGSSALGSNLAILRRAAIAEGIDVSLEEVDRAIASMRSQLKIESAVQFAVLKGFPSLAQCRDVMREGMRIGNYVRLQTLALDDSDSLVIERLLADREKITLRVASFDEKIAEQALKAAGGVSEEDLRKWLDGKSEAEKRRMQAYDPNRVELLFGAALLADGQFDPAQWSDVLKDFAPPEDEILANYDREKAARWKIEGKDEFKPLADVKPEILRILQAEQVMNHVLKQINERLTEAMKAPNEALQAEQKALGEAERSAKEAGAKLSASPDDAELKEALRKAEEAVPQRRAAADAATKAVQEARSAFDFGGAFRDVTKDKTGFVVKPHAGLRSPDDLKDLDAADLGLGQWAQSAQAAGLRSKGDMSFMPIRTTKAVALYQATNVDPLPLKPWDKLKPLAEDAYYAEKAKAEGEAKKKVFEEALLRLAKAKMPDKVNEIESKKAERIDTKLADWERAAQAGIAEAEKTLAEREPGTLAHLAWQRKLDALRAELQGKDGKRAEFEAQVAKAIETEIADEAKKFYREVMDAAAADAGFTVADHGPFPRDLSKRPRFDKAYDPVVVFLFRLHSELKENEVTPVLQDPTNRRWCFAACTKVEPLGVADLTRREFAAARSLAGLYNVSTQQAYACFDQAFTQEALEKRYDFKAAVGSQVVDKTPKPPK